MVVSSSFLISFLNAKNAMPEGGRRYASTTSNGESVSVRVSDTGTNRARTHSADCTIRSLQPRPLLNKGKTRWTALAYPSRPRHDPGACGENRVESRVLLPRLSTGTHVLLAAARSCSLLDDLHWADAASLLLLAHLVRARAPRRCSSSAPTATARSRAPTRSPHARRPAPRRPVERVALRGLDPADVAALVRGLPRRSRRRRSPRGCTSETGGNPFFVEEVLRHLPRGRRADAGIPEGVREVLGRRLSRLGDGASRMLPAAAVAGRDFDVALLERLDALAGVDVLDARRGGRARRSSSARTARARAATAFAHAARSARPSTRS